MADRTCEQCASLLGPEKRRNARFCDRSCKDLAKKAAAKAELLEAKSLNGRTCGGCGKDITYSRADARACNPQCTMRMRQAAVKDLRRNHAYPSCCYCGEVLTDRRGKVCFGAACRSRYKQEIYFRSQGLPVPDASCRYCEVELRNPRATVCGSRECRRRYKSESERSRVSQLTGDALERFKNSKSNDSHRRRLAQATEDSRPVRLRDWKRLLVRYRHRCAYCGNGGRMTKEHVIPLARGGRHAIGNLVPACWSCNCSKRHLLLVEWRRRQATKGR